MNRCFMRLESLLVAAALLCGSLQTGFAAKGLSEKGQPDIKSAGPLAFGPKGVLFIGDPQGAAIFAVEIGQTPKSPIEGKFSIDGLGAKVAGLLGTAASDILINDLAVEPESRIAFLSVSRGRGPDAEPAIVRVDGEGKLSAMSLDDVAYSKISIANAPAADAKDARGGSLRQESITDLAFVDGRLFIAGLSNEEFASKLRAVPFPFTAADTGASVEIYHGAHGKFETRSPVRTFVPFNVGGEPHLLAAYTCTPLVTFPVSQLKAGSKLRGTTVAELGNRNRPLDIITYDKDGHTYLLIANSARGVMKVSTDNIEKQEGITERIENTAGLGYETVANLKGVEHLDKLDAKNALLLVKAEGDAVALNTIELP